MRYIAFILCVLTFLIKICTPLFAILFFAVSPLDVIKGERLSKNDTPVLSSSFVCSMGIEWKAGSEKYLSDLGFAHHQGGHAQIDSDKHDAHKTHSSETKTDSSQDCPIILTFTLIQNSVLYALSAFIICIVFWLLRNLLTFKIRILEPLAKYHLYPCKHAPPSYVS